MIDRDTLVWKTSSKSAGGNCVEVARTEDRVFIRHSKDPDGPILEFDRDTFADFLAFLKEPGNDLLG